MLTFAEFILRLIPMLILSGVITFTGLLCCFRAIDWWADR